MQLESLWKRDAPNHIKVGDVYDAQGRQLDLRRLIQRRWGWPKKAALSVVEHLTSTSEVDGYKLPISGPECWDFQKGLMKNIPGLLDELLEGVGNRAQREAGTDGRHLEELKIRFTDDDGVERSIEDGGVMTNFLHVMAGRLGITLDELRDRTQFTGRRPLVELVVNIDGLE